MIEPLSVVSSHKTRLLGGGLLNLRAALAKAVAVVTPGFEVAVRQSYNAQVKVKCIPRKPFASFAARPGKNILAESKKS